MEGKNETPNHVQSSGSNERNGLTLVRPVRGYFYIALLKKNLEDLGVLHKRLHQLRKDLEDAELYNTD